MSIPFTILDTALRDKSSLKCNKFGIDGLHALGSLDKFFNGESGSIMDVAFDPPEDS